jgi:uncharacterized repeat protein (TIGR03803 family)
MNMFSRAKLFFGRAVSAFFLSAAVAHGQVLTVLHDFSAEVAYTNADGAKPLGGLTQGRDGSWYGSAEEGGTNGTGTIFKITPQGAFALVHTFSAEVDGRNEDGAYPEATFTMGNDGSLYGTSSGGGTNGNYGTVFKITTNDELVTLHSFTFYDGENPGAPLVLASDGNFYGAAALGGSNDNGTLFEITTNGDFQKLYEFSFASNSPTDINLYTNQDGSRPYGLTQGRDGNFYGTTQFCGTNGNGTVFQFATNNVLNVLHTFSPQATNGQNADGAAPVAPLTQAPDGGFYGTTPNGGAYACGTVFRITSAGDFSTLLSFNFFTNGDSSFAPLLLHDGVFFGTTGNFFEGGGTIFEITTNGAATLLYAFSQPDANSDNSDGAAIETGLTLGRDGNLYGAASEGGLNGAGTIFSLSFPTLTISSADDLTILSWPTNQIDFSLQWATDLGNPVWTLDTNVPVVVGSQWVVSNSVIGPTTFYRLIK